MKKTILLSAILIAFTTGLFAQQPSGESIRKRFSLQLNANQDFWLGVPDTIDNRFVNQGIDVYGLYNFPMDKKGHLFFFAGGGIGAHNFHHKALMEMNDDGVTILKNFEKKNSLGSTTETKISKLSITYFDIPFGFMYKSTNKFHATLGFKVGWNINDHWKYKGNYFDTETNDPEKIKWMGLKNIQKMHYGPYVTIGYKWFGISAFYQIPSIFTEELGPEIRPLSLGITFRPF